jgi:hypothetical protein
MSLFHLVRLDCIEIRAKTSSLHVSNSSIIPYSGHLAATMGRCIFRRCWHMTRMERGNPETRGNLELNRKYDDGSGLIPGTVL